MGYCQETRAVDSLQGSGEWGIPLWDMPGGAARVACSDMVESELCRVGESEGEERDSA